MQRLEVSGAVRHIYIYIYIYVVRQLKVKWKNLRERDHWGDPGLRGKIILKWILRKWDVGVWAALSWLRIGPGSEHL
jgi:hypothetical protein